MGQRMGKYAASDDARRKEIKTNYYINGNTVRRLEGEPEERLQRQREKEKEQRKRHNQRIARRNQERMMRVNFTYVLFSTMALAAVCVVCIVYIKLDFNIATKTRQISQLEDKLENLRMENDAAVRRIELTTDLEEVKKKALEYGMKYATQDQIIYYSIKVDDYMDQYFDIP